jgi:hypothetical protein
MQDSTYVWIGYDFIEYNSVEDTSSFPSSPPSKGRVKQVSRWNWLKVMVF